MTAPTDDDFETPLPSAPVDDTPTVSCSRCDNTWDLAYELDELQLGNQSIEQFALDHRRHTGHFPDDVSPWVVTCRQCPDGDQFLTEHSARRWARTHARHTTHSVELDHGEDRPQVIDPE
ncbi:hypothetical protein [Haloferax sp. DFSO60]|uniref:hypothetical protein n=1 Tax=Haloferax sp. DFSO60 TaxID=3388652 RepID=UPI0039782F22